MTALKPSDIPGFTPRTLDVADQLNAAGRPLARFSMGDRSIEVLKGLDTLWIVVRRAGKGGVALKTARSPGPVKIEGGKTEDGGRWRVTSSCGVFAVRLAVVSDSLMRITVSLTPSADLLVPFWSRDLYPLDAKDNPTRALGRVEAAQRGVNTGLCYFCLDKPAFGSVLYVQNLTALNSYFEATKTKPDGVVGGEWPELGYQPPTSPLGNSPPTEPMVKGQEAVISDALIAFRETCDPSERASALQFVEMMAEIYPLLDKPDTRHHDWPARVKRTLKHLEKSPEAVIEHYGDTYLHPYTQAEYPDCMVQASVIGALREYGETFDKPVPFADRLEAGYGRFFDGKIGCVRRYLPNVGKDKNRNAVDSWYLYHPLLNLGRLALRKDEQARKLFLGSIDYAVRAAKHFDYTWPIQFDIRNFSVIDAARDDEGLGQTDVGGIYAYVMLQAFDLTGDKAFIAEAKAALRALEGVRFELVYQTNLTAWGAVACIRLWLLEENTAYLEQAHVFVAGFIHNCELWESQIENARHYPNFFGATCLHDAPYMSQFECFESFSAFDELLRLAGDKLPEPLRMLLLEYRRFTLDRAWFAYPDALPPEAIEQDKIRNGHIDRRLSFPLEDIYGDGQKAGQVGQEVYGCGGAFIYTARAFHERKRMPFRVFTEYPSVLEPAPDGGVAVRIQAPRGHVGRMVILQKERTPLPRLRVRREDTGDIVAMERRQPDWVEFAAPQNSGLIVSWTPQTRR